jgi:hypothetical protein
MERLSAAGTAKFMAFVPIDQLTCSAREQELFLIRIGQ